MKYFAGFLFVCVFAVILQAISADHIKCSPGKSYKIDCNTCQCPKNETTGDGGCTRMECHGYSCTVGARWSDPENDCECDDNGRTICFTSEEAQTG